MHLVIHWKTGGLLRLALVALFMAESAFAASSPFIFVQSGLYRDTTFGEPVTAFTPYETIYLLVEFRQLQAGKFTLTTDWITPWGKLEHQSNHSFEIGKTRKSWKAYSWFKLWKNGPVKRLLTGEDFKKKFYGIWTVRLFLNGKRVHQQSFDVQ
ncbi:MAG: hypothetical protein D3915_12885 [Candidatus Electrothrix sp. AU1_5]|jgi:hypothetical protein|nr:hypothetical protein [Candidatus Electrothrix gigas]MCI5193999.1 hypothetical protein [Candidatus Electrothrix gigas]MCI5226444.1 hypothetical protein [Candidatus Electrothrix gigas]